MHSRTIVIKDWFGHKSDCFSIAMSNILNNILEPFESITHHQKGIKSDANFILATGRNLMMDHLNNNADTL